MITENPIPFSITRFVTVNVVKDWLNKLRDKLGLEQKSYNQIVNNTSNQILTEIQSKGKILWFRQIVDRTFDQTLQITIYGQYKPRK